MDFVFSSLCGYCLLEIIKEAKPEKITFLMKKEQSNIVSKTYLQSWKQNWCGCVVHVSG